MTTPIQVTHADSELLYTTKKEYLKQNKEQLYRKIKSLYAIIMNQRQIIIDQKVENLYLKRKAFLAEKKLAVIEFATNKHSKRNFRSMKKYGLRYAPCTHKVRP